VAVFLIFRAERVEIRCGARRGRWSRITCERPALHGFGCHGDMYLAGHAGRSRTGRWWRTWPE
jgi:hypothetical protein